METTDSPKIIGILKSSKPLIPFHNLDRIKISETFGTLQTPDAAELIVISSYQSLFLNFSEKLETTNILNIRGTLETLDTLETHHPPETFDNLEPLDTLKTLLTRETPPHLK